MSETRPARWWHLKIMRAGKLDALLSEARRAGARAQREANVIRADLIPAGMSVSWDGTISGIPQGGPDMGSITIQTRE